MERGTSVHSSWHTLLTVLALATMGQAYSMLLSYLRSQRLLHRLHSRLASAAHIWTQADLNTISH